MEEMFADGVRKPLAKIARIDSKSDLDPDKEQQGWYGGLKSLGRRF